jgi:hypothetical protein
VLREPRAAQGSVAVGGIEKKMDGICLGRDTGLYCGLVSWWTGSAVTRVTSDHPSLAAVQLTSIGILGKSCLSDLRVPHSETGCTILHTGLGEGLVRSL